MRCLTLTQPYATLVAIGAKHIETRSWATSYRGDLAIHAGAGLGPVGGKRGLYDLCYTQPFLSVLEPAMTGERDIAGCKVPHIDPGYLPLGAIVATCRLEGCVDTFFLDREKRVRVTGPDGEQRYWNLTDQERAFGDYSAGRYAWLLANIKALPEPIPCRGALSLWEPDTLTQMAIKRQEIAAL